MNALKLDARYKMALAFEREQGRVMMAAHYPRGLGQFEKPARYQDAIDESRRLERELSAALDALDSLEKAKLYERERGRALLRKVSICDGGTIAQLANLYQRACMQTDAFEAIALGEDAEPAAAEPECRNSVSSVSASPAPADQVQNDEAMTVTVDVMPTQDRRVNVDFYPDGIVSSISGDCDAVSVIVRTLLPPTED